MFELQERDKEWRRFLFEAIIFMTLAVSLFTWIVITGIHRKTISKPNKADLPVEKKFDEVKRKAQVVPYEKRIEEVLKEKRKSEQSLNRQNVKLLRNYKASYAFNEKKFQAFPRNMRTEIFAFYYCK